MVAVKRKFTFRKSERLCSKKVFEELSVSDCRINAFPLKLIYIEKDSLPEDVPVQVAFVVPKRLYKKAVDRNRVKRLMREAFRLNKTSLYEHCNLKQKKLALLLIYQSKDLPNFNTIRDKLVLILQRVMKTL